MRVVGVDYGLKRCGVAVSDPGRILATPLETVPTSELLSFLEVYLARESVSDLVVGQPLDLRGEPQAIEPHIVGFIRQMQRRFPQLRIHRLDERFTSSIAKQALMQQGGSKKNRAEKAHLDKMSAAILLRDFLEHYRS